MLPHEFRSGFSIEKVLDYVQHVHDNYDELNDGQVHYLNDKEVYVCRLGNYIKLGLPSQQTAFAFVRSQKTNLNRCDISVNSKSLYHFENGKLYKRVMSENNGTLKYSYEEEELTKEFIFHALMDSGYEYILTYEESLRILEMTKTFGFELHFQNVIKK